MAGPLRPKCVNKTSPFALYFVPASKSSAFGTEIPDKFLKPSSFKTKAKRDGRGFAILCPLFFKS